MFSDEPDSQAIIVETIFLNYVSDEYWDIFKNEDVKIVELKFSFLLTGNPIINIKDGPQISLGR